MLRTLIWCLPCLATACALDNPAQDCGDGITCPSDLACDLVHHTCVAPDELSACDGREELAACSTRMLDVGTCHEGLCIAVRCGNGIWDKAHDEGCDDGNVVAGDGCSDTCSTEACGNGTKDSGEECDDGNLLSHDGCDSQCKPEVLAWTAIDQIVAPPLAYVASAYDTDRQRLVIFGGIDSDGGYHDATVEWNGVGWRRLAPTTRPGARTGGAMAYDAARHVTVLFGGMLASGMANDTWVWDGTRWTDRTPVTGPSPRWGHVMAYDPVRERVVLFGGEMPGGYYSNETWEWDGTAWTQAQPSVAPPTRAWASATWDPSSARIVMAGGRALDPGHYRYPEDTWLWDGRQWQPGASGVGRREGATMTFDPAFGLILVGGGEEILGVGFQHADVRTLVGSAWVTVDSGAELERHGHVAFFDPHLGRTVAFGGHAGTWSIDHWEPWPASADMWSITVAGTIATVGAIETTAGPAARSGSNLAFDARRGSVVMIGGQSVERSYRDTWELADGTWRLRATDGPTYVDGAAMAYDAKRGRSVLVTSAAWTADERVWEWDGTRWLSITPTGSAPTPRSSASLAYDPGAAATMMFGGTVAGGALPRDSSQWDGRAWTKLASATAPEGRAGAGMVFAANGEAVLFGGDNRNDTWTWSAEAGWRQLATASAPSARARPALALDPQRREILLAGGTTSSFDLWRLVDDKWSTVTAYGSPTARQGVAMVYDTVHQEMILFGTVDSTPVTYSLRWQSETPDDVCEQALDLDGDGLAGCADPDCAASCSSCGNGVCDPLESGKLCAADCEKSAR